MNMRQSALLRECVRQKEAERDWAALCRLGLAFDEDIFKVASQVANSASPNSAVSEQLSSWIWQSREVDVSPPDELEIWWQLTEPERTTLSMLHLCVEARFRVEHMEECADREVELNAQREYAKSILEAAISIPDLICAFGMTARTLFHLRAEKAFYEDAINSIECGTRIFRQLSDAERYSVALTAVKFFSEAVLIGPSRPQTRVQLEDHANFGLLALQQLAHQSQARLSIAGCREVIAMGEALVAIGNTQDACRAYRFAREQLEKGSWFSFECAQLQVTVVINTAEVLLSSRRYNEALAEVNSLRCWRLRSLMRRLACASARAKIWETLGSINTRLHHPQQARYFHSKAAIYYIRKRDHFSTLRVYVSHLESAMEMGSIGEVEEIYEGVERLLAGCDLLQMNAATAYCIEGHKGALDARIPDDSFEILMRSKVILGRACLAVGNYRDAARHLQEEDSIYRFLFQFAGQPTLATPFLHLLLAEAECFIDLRQPSRALRYLGNARAMLEGWDFSHTTRDARWIDLGAVLGLLGVAQLSCGRLDEASFVASEALSVLESAKALGQSAPPVLIARVHGVLGAAYIGTDHADLSEDHLTKAIQKLEAEFEKRPEVVRRLLAQQYCTLAEALSEDNRHEAGRQLQQAIRLLEEGMENFPKTYVRSLFEAICQQGKIHLIWRDAPGALLAYQKAEGMLDVVTADGVNGAVFVARVKRGLGECFSLTGQHERACQLLKECVDLYSSDAENDYLIEQMDAYVAFAPAWQPRCSHEPEAFLMLTAEAEWLTRGIELSNRLRSRLINPQRRMTLQQDVQDLYGLMIEIAFDSMLPGTDSLPHWKAAFEAGEAARSRILLDLVSEQNEPENTPAALLEKLRAHRTGIHNAGQALDELEQKHKSDAGIISPAYDPNMRADSGDEDLQARKRTELKEHTRGYFNTVRQIETIHDWEFDPEKAIPTATIEDVQRILPDERTAAVQFSVTSRSGFAIIIGKRTVNALSLPDCTSSRLRDMRQKWSDRYANLPEYHDGSEWSAYIDSAMSTLGKVLIEPLGRYLGGFEHLILAPNHELHMFPLQAIPIKGGTRLCDLFEISFTPSLSILNRLVALPGQAGGRPLIFGALGSYLPLPTMETRSLASRLNCSEVLDPADISLEELISKSAQANVWHFAGHGPEHMSALCPLEEGLFMDDRQQWLRLRDTFLKLKLPSAKIVTLNGCLTAVMQPNKMDEFVSFTTAFLYAGAQSVVGSLWEVNDLAGALLMDRFYLNLLDGTTAASALRMAQKWLRGTPDHRGESLADGNRLQEVLQELIFQNAVTDDEREDWEDVLSSRWCQAVTPPFAGSTHWASHVANGICWLPFDDR